MTLSISAWIVLLVGMVVLLVLRRDSFVFRNILLTLGIFAILAVVNPYSKSFIQAKVGSIQLRICSTLSATTKADCQKFVSILGLPTQLQFDFETQGTAAKEALNPTTFTYSSNSTIHNIVNFLIGRRGQATFNENFYLETFLNYGLIGLSLLLAIFGLTLRRSYELARGASGSLEQIFGSFALATLVAALVGMMALPYLSIYPINFYIWLVVALVFSIPARNKLNLK